MAPPPAVTGSARSDPSIVVSTNRLARIGSSVLGCLILWSTIVSLGVLAGGSLWIDTNLERLHRRTRSSLVDFCTCDECPKTIIFKTTENDVDIKKQLVCCPDC